MVSLFLADTTVRASAAGDHVATWIISLIVLSATIAIRVAWASRRGTSDLKSLASKFVPAAWIVPALAIIIAVAVQAAPQLLPRQPPSSATDLPFDNTRLVVEGQSWTAVTLVEKDRTGRPRVFTPIASKPHSTVEEARREALELAARRLKYEVERVYGQAGKWELPGNLLQDRHFIANEITTARPYALSSLAPSSDMHQCIVQLEISDASRKWAAAFWKQSVGMGRLNSIGTITALLCLLVITAHIYLRLDIASVGKHRGKLQLAAVATVAAAGLLASTVLSA